MELSVFKKITLPKNKEEKGLLARYSSNPYIPEIIICNNIKDLLSIISTYGYSPNIFNGFRKQDNFKYTDFCILDIDEGLSIQDAHIRIEKTDLTCICLPTSSHTEQNHRFRLIFPLSSRIDNINDFKSTMGVLVDIFPEADPSCTGDYSRFFFPSILSDEGFIYNGILLKPSRVIETPLETFGRKRVVTVGHDIENVIESIFGAKRDTIPESIDFFIRNASTGIPNGWNNALNAFCFSLAINGLTYDQIYDIVKSIAPEPLDSRDEYTIERSFNDGHDVYITNGE